MAITILLKVSGTGKYDTKVLILKTQFYQVQLKKKSYIKRAGLGRPSTNKWNVYFKCTTTISPSDRKHTFSERINFNTGECYYGREIFEDHNFTCTPIILPTVMFSALEFYDI